MTASTPASPGIFISYRRNDSAAYAGWLFDRLAGHFGREQIFKDVDSIQLGDDFAAAISAAVASCLAPRHQSGPVPGRPNHRDASKGSVPRSWRSYLTHFRRTRTPGCA